MEFNRWFIIGAILILMVFESAAAGRVIFDFHLNTDLHNESTHHRLCKDLGYDGLAILSAPEAYAYALKITNHSRKVYGSGAYIGAHYRPEAGIVLWDDDTVPRSDTPFYSSPAPTDPNTPCSLLDIYNKIWMSSGVNPKLGLCGNHKIQITESIGVILPGELQASSKAVLSVSQASRHLQCVLRCSMILECRAAQFNSDLLTCTVIGEYTPPAGSSFPVSNQIFTYVRVTF
ncbi:hypothetical protein RRG08_014581 [Elysia crispata]|uniref:Uncharacterized protein n=1 Tax=Elysia crispata TaxID=231223 RepID=A0AAE1D0H0_9GAST|nr:hypothetical protein RRG08_014581 [Elysia crispata]